MIPFVRVSLMENKVHFLRMFSDAGFEMHEFATAQAVEELFTRDAQLNVRNQRNHLNNFPRIQPGSTNQIYFKMSSISDSQECNY